MKFTWGIKKYDDVVASLFRLNDNIQNLTKFDEMMKEDLEETKKRKFAKLEDL